MKCSECNRDAVAEIRPTKKQLCDSCFLKLYEQRVRRNIAKNKMFTSKGERIAVCVSGGKDSLSLLNVLKDMHYDNIMCVTIDEGIRGYRSKTIPCVKKLCKRLGVPLHIYSFKDEYGFTLDDAAKNGRPCSYCGVLRRHLMNRAARQLRCTRLATGHNLDDESQAVLMNFFRGELQRMARGGAVTGTTADKLFVQRVKPLRVCSEKDDVVYALLKGIDYCDAECPYSGYAYRNAIRDALTAIEERHPGTKSACLNTYDKLVPILKEHYKDEKPNHCDCGEPTAGEECKVCQIRKEFSRAPSRRARRSARPRN